MNEATKKIAAAKTDMMAVARHKGVTSMSCERELLKRRLLESIGQYSAEIATSGELAPPQYLLDVVDEILAQPEAEIVAASGGEPLHDPYYLDMRRQRDAANKRAAAGSGYAGPKQRTACVCEFDAWKENPYTKVLQKSIDEDYVPKHDPHYLDMRKQRDEAQLVIEQKNARITSCEAALEEANTRVAEARAAAIEDVISLGTQQLAFGGVAEFYDEEKKRMRALAALPSGYVVVPVDLLDILCSEEGAELRDLNVARDILEKSRPE